MDDEQKKKTQSGVGGGKRHGDAPAAEAATTRSAAGPYIIQDRSPISTAVDAATASLP